MSEKPYIMHDGAVYVSIESLTEFLHTMSVRLERQGHERVPHAFNELRRVLLEREATVLRQAARHVYTSGAR